VIWEVLQRARARATVPGGLNAETVVPGCYGNGVAAGNAGQWDEQSSVYQKRDAQVLVDPLCIIDDDTLPARGCCIFWDAVFSCYCFACPIFFISPPAPILQPLPPSQSYHDTHHEKKRKTDDPTINPRQSTDTHRESSVS
jgi:hypothetical protein